MTMTDTLKDIPVMPTTHHKAYNLGSDWNSVLRLAQEQYTDGRHEAAINTMRAWEALPEEAIEWFCKLDELPIEDGNVVIYWPPLSEETA